MKPQLDASPEAQPQPDASADAQPQPNVSPEAQVPQPYATIQTSSRWLLQCDNDWRAPEVRLDAVVLRLVVRDHPGVLSHVSGLFARRAFNVDGVLCLPLGDGARSAILLLVRDDERLEQLERQLAKLEDVLDIGRRPDARRAFAAVAEHIM